MPWFLRKSFGSKFFKINLSKSGIGFSAGIPGLRVSTNKRGTYLNMGKGGLYYRQRVGGSASNSSSASETAPQPNQNQAANYQANTSYANPSIWPDPAVLTDNDSRPTAQFLNNAAAQPQYFLVSLITAIGLTIIAMAIQAEAGILIGLVSILPLIFINKADNNRRSVHLPSSVSHQQKANWDRVTYGISVLMGSGSLSGFTFNEQQLADTGEIVFSQRHACQFIHNALPYISTDVTPYMLYITGGILIFLPERVLILVNNTFGAVQYKNLRIASGNISVLEGFQPSPDAKVIGERWLYETKDGNPDRRYANNPRMPIVQYKLIEIIINNAHKVYFLVSSHTAADAFVDAFVPITSSVPRQSANNNPIPKEANAKQSSHPPPQPPPAPKAEPAKSPYSILGLTPNCAKAEAAQAYRVLVQQYHPDKVAHLGPEFKALAESKMREINWAYDELSRLQGW